MLLCLLTTIVITSCVVFLFFFFNDTATTEIYTLSLHDALPIKPLPPSRPYYPLVLLGSGGLLLRSEEHTSELQSLRHLVCRLLLEKKKHDLTARYAGSILCDVQPSVRQIAAVGARDRLLFFFFNDTATTEIYTLSLHDALPI